MVMVSLALTGCLGGGASAPVDGGLGGEASLYPQVEAIMQRSCAIERCHKGTIYGAGLVFGDVHDSLVDVPSCLYNRMQLIEPFSPEESWVWVKLTAPFRPPEDFYSTFIYFDPPGDWDGSERACEFNDAEGRPLFGSRMPLTAPNQLADEELAVIRRWIEQGAPE